MNRSKFALEDFSGFFMSVNQFVSQYDLLRPHDAVIAAVSGGVDSVVMLTYLAWLKQFQPFYLEVAHLNHGLRGGESEHDAEFSRRLAEAYAVPFHLKIVPVKHLAQDRGRGVEEAGRYARQAFFRERVSALMSEGYRDATIRIATGHHLDDLGETVAINLSRGTGLAGLTSLNPKQGRYIRPLLNQRSDDIVRFAEQMHLAWVEDSTNATDDYLRNCLRNKILPLWSEAAGRDMSLLLGRLSFNLQADAEYLEAESRRLYESALFDGVLRADRLAEAPEALLQRVIIYWLEDYSDIGDQITRRHRLAIERLIRQPEGGKSIDLPENYQVKKRKGRVTLTRFRDIIA